jgi:hypothetical protein
VCCISTSSNFEVRRQHLRSNSSLLATGANIGVGTQEGGDPHAWALPSGHSRAVAGSALELGAGQYQQRPAPIEGNLIKRSEVRYYGGIDPRTGQGDENLPANFDRKLISVDCAFKDLATSDYGRHRCHRYQRVENDSF